MDISIMQYLYSFDSLCKFPGLYVGDNVNTRVVREFRRVLPYAVGDSDVLAVLFILRHAVDLVQTNYRLHYH